MKFSLIIATYGRLLELEELFQSLIQQTYTNFEIIVVDQNETLIDDLVLRYCELLPIKNIKSEKGLSKARNIGLKYAKGEIIAFPDDDCIYPADTLEKVNNFFLNNPSYSGLTGVPVDFKGGISTGNFQKKSCDLNKSNVWKTGISFTIFLKKEVCLKTGYFDENLGVGSRTKFGSGEETDYLIRCIDNNFKIKYYTDILIYHPDPFASGYKKSLHRAYSYGCGFGYVLKKHNYSLLIKAKYLLRPFLGFLLSSFYLNFDKAKFHFKVFQGRASGLFTRGN